jgi:hypothetical protein
MPSLSRKDTKAGRLQRACLAKLEEHERDGALPTNATFVFYELEQDGKIPKKYLKEDGKTPRARTPRQDVSDAVMVLREIGAISWDWITDETREIAEWEFAATVYEYEYAIEAARIDCWDGKPAPLVICESRATKGVLQRVCGEYLVPITATSGQSGAFLLREVVPVLRDDNGDYNGREILYIGDREIGGPGDQIEANTKRYLVRHTGATVRWLRIALTQTQVDNNKRLLERVINKLDNRCKPPRPYEAVECEAVGQAELEQILRAAIEVRLPEPLDAVRVREEAQRRDLVDRLTAESC